MNSKKRNIFIDKKTKENGGEIKGLDKLNYFERMIIPYDKKGKKLFITQYLSGDGNELNKKFWAVNSSSRFAFELYSWMAREEAKDVLDFQFEKKLKNIVGSPKNPNMDVYIEKKDEIIFIESKFSESSSQNIDKLSDSYYLELGKSKNSKTKLLNRYHKNEKLAIMIPKFINDVKERLSRSFKSCWMDYKQEITHLIGIAISVISEPDKYRNKDIKFYNIYYDFEDDVDSPIEWFFERANEMMNELLKGICKSFVYNHMTAQKMVETNEIALFKKDIIAFGKENETIGEILEKQFDLKLN